MFKFFPQHLPKEGSSNKKSHYPGGPQDKIAEGEIIKRPPDTGIFGSHSFLTRTRFKREVEKDKGKVPGMGTYNRKEREKIIEEDFSKERVGTHIMPYEITKRIKDLKKSLHGNLGPGGSSKVRKKIKYLEKLKGTKDER
jgi:hypothetical protein